MQTYKVTRQISATEFKDSTIQAETEKEAWDKANIYPFGIVTKIKLVSGDNMTFTVKKWYQTVSNGQRIYIGFAVIDDKGAPTKAANGQFNFFKTKATAQKQADWMNAQ